MEEGALARVRLLDVVLLIAAVPVSILLCVFLDAVDALLGRFVVGINENLRVVLDLGQIVVVGSYADVVEFREVGARSAHALVAVMDSVEIWCVWTPLGAESLSL